MAFRLKDLQERDQFDLKYIHETNVKIGNIGTPTEPPFCDIKVWNPHQQRVHDDYHVKVDPHTGFITEGKS